MEQLSVEDWKIREQGIFALSDLETQDHKPNKERQNAILKLLEKEVQQYTAAKDQLLQSGKSADQIADALSRQFPPQTYGEYIKALAFLSATEKIDHSLPMLFRLIVDTDYNISPAILTLYGTSYVDFFLKKSSSSKSHEREMAIAVLAAWIDPSTTRDALDTQTVVAIERVLLNAMHDQDYNVRYMALSGVERLVKKPEIRTIVEQVAISDREPFIRQKAAEILKNGKK